MNFIEDIGVSEERAETGFRAQIDRPAAILHAWKISWIRITEDSSTEGDEARMLPLFERMGGHTFIVSD
jgi:hypothetical protein